MLTARAYSSGTYQRPAVACRPALKGRVVARATPKQQQLQQQLQFEQDATTWFTAESRWRLFGFGATACTQRNCKSVHGTEYVSMAAYDLASGDLFNTLVNPKLHDPGYRFTPSRLQGLSKEEVLSEGVHVLAAFDQLVDFVHSHTPPGQTPVIVGHQGFELLFKHVEQCLQRAASATAGPSSSSASVMGGSGSSSGGSTTIPSSTCSTTGRRRRLALEPLAKTRQGKADPSALGNSSSTGYQHSSWPQEWMLLDTYVMARVLHPLLSDVLDIPEGHALRDKLLCGLYTLNNPEGVGSSEDLELRGDSLGALDALLLPQRQHSGDLQPQQRQDIIDSLLPRLQRDGVLQPEHIDARLMPQRQHVAPRDAALQAAVSTARLAQLLLMSMQDVSEDITTLVNNQKRPFQETSAVLHKAIDWQHYAPWVSQPYCLNPPNHSKGRFPYARFKYPPRYEFNYSYRELQHIPTSMLLAGREAAEACDEALESVRFIWFYGDLTHHLKCLETE